MLKKLTITIAVLGALAFVADGSFPADKLFGWGFILIGGE